MSDRQMLTDYSIERRLIEAAKDSLATLNMPSRDYTDDDPPRSLLRTDGNVYFMEGDILCTGPIDKDGNVCWNEVGEFAYGSVDTEDEVLGRLLERTIQMNHALYVHYGVA